MRLQALLISGNPLQFPAAQKYIYINPLFVIGFSSASSNISISHTQDFKPF